MPLHDSPCIWPQEGCICTAEEIFQQACKPNYFRNLNQHKFLQAVTCLKVAFQDLNFYWDQLEKQDQEILQKEHSFIHSGTFDQFADVFAKWQDSIIEGWKL